MAESRKLGYVVLTKGPTGEWQPDWDGILHPSRADADAELQRAEESWEATLGVVYDLLAVPEGAPAGASRECSDRQPSASVHDHPTPGM